MEYEEFTLEELEGIQKRFDLFCKKVIRNCVKNQIRAYVRYCKHYKTVSIDEWTELLDGVNDEYFSEKTEIKIGNESIFLESWQLAEAIQKLSIQKKYALLLAVVLDYSIEEVALELHITKKTATDYKYQALKELRREVEKYEKKEKRT